MERFLVFRLYGPMAAWGDTAVGEFRPTYSHPGKSAILGLLAAAKGVRRSEEVIHREMADAYGVAVASFRQGTLLRDYHTVQVPSQQKNIIHRTRRDELMADKLNTILSTRDYRSDGLWVVAVRERGGHFPFSLEELAAALREPVFTLYLGRKSCPTAAPLEPQVIEAETTRQALDNAKFGGDWFSDPKHFPATAEGYFWEEADAAIFGHQPAQTFVRRDLPLSRRRWQFIDRREHYAPGKQKGE